MLLEPFGSLLETPRPRQSRAVGARDFFPAADLVRSEDEVTLVMDVPGLRSDDLEIELSDGMLWIRGERLYPYTQEQAGRSVHRLERGYGRFERVLQVPRDVDPGALTAAIEDGVLTLRIPVPETRKPRRIEIGGGGTQRVIDAEWSTDGADQVSEEGEKDSGARELAGAGG
ncbi:MAG: Hsp20/alpha crystallin family protein [Actinobacteria bacterium]|nr:Hsp20/alpha crystallin family protein [Actinomycetota bacterium]